MASVNTSDEAVAPFQMEAGASSSSNGNGNVRKAVEDPSRVGGECATVADEVEACIPDRYGEAVRSMAFGESAKKKS